MPDRLVAHLEDQLAQGRAILEALGHDPGRLQWFSDEEQESSLALPRHAGLTPRLRSLEQSPGGPIVIGVRHMLAAVFLQTTAHALHASLDKHNW